MDWLPNLQLVVAFAGIWTLGNGILHDVFVLRDKKVWDRELIRLMIDGHVLMFGGIVYLICFRQLNVFNLTAWWVCVANALFLLGYCALIYRMLPAIGMILLNLIVLTVLWFIWLTF